MKKYATIVALVTALVLLLGMAMPAMASQESSTQRLMSLGLVEGDPDGNLRLSDNITRAEFSKVAVIAAGLEDAAATLKSTPSRFSDVKTGEWYTGWINVAAAQGYVKGDPDGTFRPNDNIKQSEVITILLRLLGYNDNLPGDWPTDYIVKAAALEVTKGISFDASAAAVRGDVFVLTDNTLDTDTVTYDKEKDEFSAGVAPKTLVAKNIESEYKKGVLEFVAMNSDGDVVATIDGTEYKVLENATIVGADDAFAAENNYVKFVAADKSGLDEISYLEVTEDRTVVTGKVSAALDQANNKVKLGSTWYKYDDAFKLSLDLTAKKDYDGTDTSNDADKYTEAELAAAIASGDQATLVYKGSDLVLAKFDTYAPKVVDEVRVKTDETRIVSKGSGSDLIDTKDDTYLVLKNGKAATFADIAEDDVYQVFASKRGVDTLVVVKDARVSGTMEKAETDYSKVTVAGKSYTLDNAANFYKTNDTAIAAGDRDDLVGAEVTVLVGFNGNAVRVVGDAEASTTEFPVILTKDVVKVTTATGDDSYINVLKADGTKQAIKMTKDTKFTLSNTGKTAISDAKIAGWDAFPVGNFDATYGLGEGDLVYLTLTSDGDVSTLKGKTVITDAAVDAQSKNDLNSSEDRINLSGSWYGVNDSTIIFKSDTTADKYEVLTWADVEASGTIPVTARIKDAWVKEMVITDETNVATKATIGMVTGKYVTSSGTVLDLDVAGESVSYTLTSSTESDADAAKKNLVGFSLDSKGKIKSIDLANVADTSISVVSSVYVEDFNSTSLTLKTDSQADLAGTETNYFAKSSVMVYDVSGSSVKVLTFGDLAKEDKIDLYIKSNEVVYILIK